MFRLNNETEDLLLSKRGNRCSLNKQDNKKDKATRNTRNYAYEPKENIAYESFSLAPPNPLEPNSAWMFGMTSLVVYHQLFDLVREEIKFELFQAIEGVPSEVPSGPLFEFEG